MSMIGWIALSASIGALLVIAVVFWKNRRPPPPPPAVMPTIYKYPLVPPPKDP